MTDSTDSPVMTVRQCAAYLRIGVSHAYEMVRQGKLPSLALGRKILIPRAAVDRLLQEAAERVSQPPGSGTPTES